MQSKQPQSLNPLGRLSVSNLTKNYTNPGSNLLDASSLLLKPTSKNPDKSRVEITQSPRGGGGGGGSGVD